MKSIQTAWHQVKFNMPPCLWNRFTVTLTMCCIPSAVAWLLQPLAQWRTGLLKATLLNTCSQKWSASNWDDLDAPKRTCHAITKQQASKSSGLAKTMDKANWHKNTASSCKLRLSYYDIQKAVAFECLQLEILIVIKLQQAGNNPGWGTSPIGYRILESLKTTSLLPLKVANLLQLYKMTTCYNFLKYV